LTEVTTVNTPTLAAAQQPKNSGLAIANITDGFSGAAPDRGAVIEGRPSVFYGDRSLVPSYISSLTDFQSIQMNGALAPVNGTTSMQSVTPAEWLSSDPGTIDLDGVVGAWSGGGKGIGTKLIVHGGGHNDSANNGAYIFDYAGTTKPQGWVTPLDVSAVSAVQQGGVYSDGASCSTHTYDGLVYVPFNNSMYKFYGAPWSTNGGFTNDSWRYDLSSASWSQPPDGPVSAGGEPTCCYDAVSNKILLAIPNQLGAAFYRVAANTWSSVKGLSSGGSDCAMTYDPTRGRAIVVNSSIRRLYTIDWSAETVSDGTFSPSGSTAILNSSALSAFYDLLLDCYWLFGGDGSSPGYASVYRMNASTFAITQHALSQTIPKQASNYLGSYGRFIFMDSWRAIGFLAQNNAAPWVIKLPNS
jgi:hypothetical protein